MTDPKRLLIAGDFHGDTNHQGYIYQMAFNNDADAIIQVGDYGLWPNHDTGKGMLYHAARQYLKRDIPLYFVDGNHEDHWWLRDHGHADAEGFSEIQPGLIFIPRGHRWEWSGVKFLGFGGAYSIDKAYRTEGVSWFPEELANYNQINRVLDDPDPVDIVFMHDAPVKPPGLENGYKDDPTSITNRQAMAAIVGHVKPSAIYHGHYHYSYETEHGDGKVIGLDMNYGNRQRSWTILDLGPVDDE